MKVQILGVVSASMFSLGLVASADAALVSRLGGQAVYDTDLDVTWLANANLAASNAFGVTGIITDSADRNAGRITWETANSWIAAMNADGGTGYLGFNDWRLPSTLVPDISCNGAGSTGFNCTGSEMGHIFYDEFNATQSESVRTSGDPVELNKFSNIREGYWSGRESALNTDAAWLFLFNGGSQAVNFKSANNFAWAVRSGDVGAVPVPAAVWLFGSGLIGLLGMAKRKR